MQRLIVTFMALTMLAAVAYRTAAQNQPNRGATGSINDLFDRDGKTDKPEPGDGGLNGTKIAGDIDSGDQIGGIGDIEFRIDAAKDDIERLEGEQRADDRLSNDEYLRRLRALREDVAALRNAQGVNPEELDRLNASVDRAQSHLENASAPLDRAAVDDLRDAEIKAARLRLNKAEEELRAMRGPDPAADGAGPDASKTAIGDDPLGAGGATTSGQNGPIRSGIPSSTRPRRAPDADPTSVSEARDLSESAPEDVARSDRQKLDDLRRQLGNDVAAGKLSEDEARRRYNALNDSLNGNRGDRIDKRRRDLLNNARDIASRNREARDALKSQPNSVTFLLFYTEDIPDTVKQRLGRDGLAGRMQDVADTIFGHDKDKRDASKSANQLTALVRMTIRAELADTNGDQQHYRVVHAPAERYIGKAVSPQTRARLKSEAEQMFKRLDDLADNPKTLSPAQASELRERGATTVHVTRPFTNIESWERGDPLEQTPDVPVRWTIALGLSSDGKPQRVVIESIAIDPVEVTAERRLLAPGAKPRSLDALIVWSATRTDDQERFDRLSQTSEMRNLGRKTDAQIRSHIEETARARFGRGTRVRVHSRVTHSDEKSDNRDTRIRDAGFRPYRRRTIALHGIDVMTSVYTRRVYPRGRDFGWAEMPVRFVFEPVIRGGDRFLLGASPQPGSLRINNRPEDAPPDGGRESERTFVVDVRKEAMRAARGLNRNAPAAGASWQVGAPRLFRLSRDEREKVIRAGRKREVRIEREFKVFGKTRKIAIYVVARPERADADDPEGERTR